MKNDKINKIFCFIVPNLLYVTFFSYFYNCVYTPIGDSFEILFSHIFIMSLIYFIIFGIFYLIIKRKTDYIKTYFLIISLILLSFEFIYKSWIMLLIIFVINFFIFKLSNETKYKFIFLFSYIIIMLFIVNMTISIKNCFSNISRYNSKDIEIEFKINNKNDSPNIYWIHCDAMVNLSDAKKYFKFENKVLENYLVENEFYINENASLYSAGHTIQALVSMYNPKYYDEVFEKYLKNTLNDDYSDKIISYDMLTEKRLNNELFKALELKNFKISVISDFNQYASFYGNYMFDYYSFQKSKSRDLDYFTNTDNTYEDIKKYTNFSHLKTLADTTFLHYFTDDYNFLNHKEIKYNDLNFENYSNIDKAEYWKARAILKSLNITYNKKQNYPLFTFIDFDINHTPWLYDANGKKVNTNKEGFLLKNFKDNYEYSTKVLTDILKFINHNDEEAIIILQADHGIHTVSTEHLIDSDNETSSGNRDLSSSTFSAIYIPKKYINGDEKYLNNPLNISRYLVNNIVGKNYNYIDNIINKS